MAAQRIGLAGVAVVSDLMDEHIDSDSRCSARHPLMLVAEGYAYCYIARFRTWAPWRLTPPHASRMHWWSADEIVGRDGERIEAWCGIDRLSLASALDFIQQDIEAHRELPYDEDRERARLRPV